MDTNTFVNGIVAQLVDGLAEAVIAKMPYFKDLDATLRGLRDGITALDDRLATLEKSQVQNLPVLVTKETVEGMITDQLSDYVLTDDLKDAINEELPDFEDLVNEHLPDMDDFVKRDDIEDMVQDSLGNSDIVESEEFNKLKGAASKTEQQVNNLRVLMHTLKTEIEQYLSPALK